jgi:hypothetical protein
MQLYAIFCPDKIIFSMNNHSEYTITKRLMPPLLKGINEKMNTYNVSAGIATISVFAK